MRSIYLYVPGEPIPDPKARIPEGEKENFTVWHEVILKPGNQHIIPPRMVRWFQAGEEGAAIDDYSSKARDLQNGFTNATVGRATEIIED